MRAALLLTVLLAVPLPASAVVPWPTCIPSTQWEVMAQGAPGNGVELVCMAGPVPFAMGGCLIAEGESVCAAAGTYDGPPGHVACRPRGGAVAYSCESYWNVGVP